MAIKTCYPLKCFDELDKSKPERVPMIGRNGNQKRSWSRRCCGERMLKFWIESYWKCHVCDRERSHHWGTEVVCSICNSHKCTGTPYG